MFKMGKNTIFVRQKGKSKFKITNFLASLKALEFICKVHISGAMMCLMQNGQLILCVYSLFARFRHLRGEPQPGSNMNENVT